jgi:hypothetical protein
MARVAEALDLSPAELRAIAVNGFRRGFGPPDFLERAADEADRAWGSWAGIS